MIKPLSTVSFSLQSDLIIENFCRFLIRIIPTNCITCAKDVLNVFILGYNIISRALFDLIYLMNILFDQNDMYKNFKAIFIRIKFFEKRCNRLLSIQLNYFQYANFIALCFSRNANSSNQQMKEKQFICRSFFAGEKRRRQRGQISQRV